MSKNNTKNKNNKPIVPNANKSKSTWKKYAKYGAMTLGVGLGATVLGTMGAAAYGTRNFVHIQNLDGLYAKYINHSELNDLRLVHTVTAKNVSNRFLNYDDPDGLIQVFVHLLNCSNIFFKRNRRWGFAVAFLYKKPDTLFGKIRVSEHTFKILEKLREQKVDTSEMTLRFDNPYEYAFYNRYRKHVINGKVYDTKKSLKLELTSY